VDQSATAAGDYARLYRQAFERFGISALWSCGPVPNPTPADALAITHSLRVEGNLQARRLAEEIERACGLIPAPVESGAEAPASGDYVSLYRQAFAHYSVRALWNKRLLDEPSHEDALVVARALRIEGDLEARQLAEQIEQACRAAL